MTDLGWGNDPEVWAKVKELKAQGEVFREVRTDHYGHDTIYESENYKYHLCSD